MKKIFLAFALAISALILTSCQPESKPLTVYVKGIYNTYFHEGHTTTQALKDNELYKFMTESIENLNKTYSKEEIAEVDDVKAAADFDNAVADLAQVKNDFDAMIASGKDFGNVEFDHGYKYLVLKESRDTVKQSEEFVFRYTSNYRIIGADTLKINTTLSGSVSAQDQIVIADSKISLTIEGFKLYNEDGTPSDSGLITNVKAVSAEDFTAFDIYYTAKQGVNPGKFYILVTYYDNEDPDKALFDFQIPIEHITK